jgi:hypothetical protein
MRQQIVDHVGLRPGRFTGGLRLDGERLVQPTAES